MRVYHFLKMKYGIEAIENQQLKIARLNSLNDPFEGFHLDTQNYGTRITLSDRRKRASRQYGILCFSKDYSNPVQWAHYAESHRGICLGFDVPDSLLLKVEYTDSRTPGIDFKKSLDIKGADYIRYMLSKKHTHWKYEQEYRLLVKFPEKVLDNRLIFEKFSEQITLKEVIIGFQSTISKKQIKKTLNGHVSDIEISKASLSEHSYRIEKNCENA